MSYSDDRLLILWMLVHISTQVHDLSNNVESLMNGNTSLQDKINALTAAVAADNVEVAQVVSTLQGLVATISALNAQIQANPSPDQLAALDAFVQGLNTSTQQLSDAVASIPTGDVTPPAPAPEPTP